MVFSLLIVLPIVLSSNTVLAQNAGYSIDKVDHQVQVMYSGHVVILDTIHVSGQVTDGFMIGLPAKYSAYVLKALAYDENNVYQMNLGVQLGNRSGFYGAEINFNGNSPTVFNIAFILSNRLITGSTRFITGQNFDDYTLDFPAYPSLVKDVGTCNVTITLPSAPYGLTVSKNDGNVSEGDYIKTNLPAYTYSPATASFEMPTGTIQVARISELNRRITIDPAGLVTSFDSYHIINNSTLTLYSFVMGLPLDATDIVVKDEFGRTLTTDVEGSAIGNILLANTTLVTFIASSQSTVITAQYNLPSATLQGSHYVLGDFSLFPNFYYYVDHAIIKFVPPEGATIVTPQLASLDSSSTLTRESFQDTLTVTRDGISHIDYSVPEQNVIQLSYDYNPVWVSFRPTFWASFLAVIGCTAVIFVRRRKPKEEEPHVTRREQRLTLKPTPTESIQQTKDDELKTDQHVTADKVREFIDAYEDKKQLNVELKSLDTRAQKGKIPRRQYKVQRRAIEIRLEGLTRSIERTKEMFRGSSGIYADLVRQLDSAEADLAEAEENIRSLETRQSKGEISLEFYKRNIGDYPKRKDKAESTINGILLRLREKTR
jgi:hypothetical protein